MTFLQASSATAVTLLLTTTLSAGEASGRFKLGKESITPKYATAYQTRDQSNAREVAIEVVLTEVPFDASFAATEIDPHVVTINAKGLLDGNYIFVWIRQDGSVAMKATFSEGMRQYMSYTTTPELKAEVTTNTADTVAGRVYTPKSVKGMGDERYEMDVKFSATVVRKPEGKKLPADGGAPMKALNALYAAFSKKDFKGLKSNLSEGTLKQLVYDYQTEQENLNSMVEILKAWLPKKIKFTGGHTISDTAILEVEGELYEGRNALFFFQMKKSANRWVYERSVPAGMLEN